MRRSLLPPDHNSAPGMAGFRIVLLVLAFVGVVWLARSGASSLSQGVMMLAGPTASAGSGSGSGLSPAEQAALDARNRELQARLAAAVAGGSGSGSGAGSGATP